MKQLKFMLAAATAISLATAAQAAPVNENFNGYSTDMIGAAITNVVYDSNNSTLISGIPGFSFEGTDGENESAIVADGENDMALNVNTGTDPLLCQLDIGSKVDLTEANLQSLNIDTMVQFTVTPAGDTVTAGADDKLMIYLKEVSAEGDTPASTNLMVKALKYKAGSSGWNEELEDYVTIDPVKEAGDWEVEYSDGTAVDVSAKSWYSLKVTTKLVDKVPMFNIYLGGKLLKPKTNLNMAESNSAYFPSLLAEASTTLTYVGFAGEGLVDDLVVTKDYEATSVDFTFTLSWDEAGFSSVTYTIDGVAGDEAVNGGSFTVEDGKKLVIDYKLNDWYKISGSPVLEYTAAGNGTDSLTLEAVKTANATTDTEGNVVKIEVTENTKPADVGVTTGSFAADTTTATELNKALTWAISKGGATASNVGTVVGALNFSDETETITEQAYLLNVADDADAVAEAKAAFKFESFNPLNPPTANDFAAKGYNGTVTIKKSSELGTWDDTDGEGKGEGKSFFKAVLTK